jgi:hypothetical protein
MTNPGGHMHAQPLGAAVESALLFPGPLGADASVTAGPAGVLRARLGPNGPASRDVGPQRLLMPQGKAVDAKQPANGGGEYL